MTSTSAPCPAACRRCRRSSSSTTTRRAGRTSAPRPWSRSRTCCRTPATVAGIVISGVSRTFGTVRAVDNVSLEVGEGEFFTLLGPSGCGKTTLLRMIAGFCELDSGEIRFGSERIDRLPAHLRDIGMVFQNYAVFPNLTVAGNVAYGLKARKVAAPEAERRVEQALALVQLSGYGGARPPQLSGGQPPRGRLSPATGI